MKQNYFLLLLGVFSSGWLSAQESVVASGGSGSGVGGSNTYSVGQVNYTEISGPGGFAIQGVQQPYKILILGNDDHKHISLNISAYPNPAISILTLRIDVSMPRGFRYELFDLNGRILQAKGITETETSIPMESYESATYILKVYANQFQLKTFKIIKKNNI